MKSYDWSTLRAARSATKVPDAVITLQNAKTDDAAENASCKIENTVVVQGMLYESAVPTASLLLSALSLCTSAARPKILELLVQIGSGETAPLEIEIGNFDLAKRCRQEVCRGFSVYKEAFSNAGNEELCWCIDLLGLCSLENQARRAEVELLFSALLLKPVDKDTRQLVENWMRE